MTQTPTDALRLVPDCQCNRCAQEAVGADGGSPFDPRLVRMFCCVLCGNKRCPHATDHRLSCTGSNESGQEGSSYGPPLKSAPASPLPGGGTSYAAGGLDVLSRIRSRQNEQIDRAEADLNSTVTIRLNDAKAIRHLLAPAAPTGDA